VDCNKIFLDANILLDFLNQNRPNHKSAHKLLYFLELNSYSMVISEDMITNIFYIEKNKKNVLNFLNDIILNGWIISPFGKEVITNAIDLSLKNNLDLEDTLQCLCAKENQCEVLITNDKKFYDCGISVYSINEFLDKQKELK